MAGVHWRTNYTKSFVPGEKVAIGILRDQCLCYNVDYYFAFTRFDGTGIRILKFNDVS
ncbi:phosphoesterase, PA-phosphatase related protein [Flammeovirgaceae bacterium 311]|nr:phosphoesterase, PA-phosphatase related protein [Flammeovirgaceae bacterium 311]